MKNLNRRRGGNRFSRCVRCFQFEVLEPRLVFAAQPIISEFLASNDDSLLDDNGNTSDWIELYNAGDAAIDLAGHTLTDDPNEIDKWVFPSVTLAPNEFLVVFAGDDVNPALGTDFYTGFNLSAGGEYVGLYDPSGTVISEFGVGGTEYPAQRTDVSYGYSFEPLSPPTTETLIDFGSNARVLVPSSSAVDAVWREPTFDDASWSLVPTPLGYDASSSGAYLDLFSPTGTDGFDGTDVAAELPGTPSRMPTVYARYQFDVFDASSVTSLQLDVQFEDGFIAYLNGVEVESFNAPSNPGYNSTTANGTSRGDDLAVQIESFVLDGADLNNLVDGTNSLAVHMLNTSSNSTDLLFHGKLSATSAGESALRMPLEEGFLATPTPGAANGTRLLGILDDVSFSVERGFFTDPINVEMSSNTVGANIYYTTDGTVPTPTNSTATLYTGAVGIDSTTNLRAAAFLDDYEPSGTSTQTYIFLEDVLAQDPLNVNGNGATPDNGLDYPTKWQGGFSADYEIDPRVVTQWDDTNPADPTDFGIREALQSIPTISLTLPHEDLWGTGSTGFGGIYPNATSEGPQWTRAGSVEYFDPVTGDMFQYNAGIKMQGAASRDNLRLKKHSFRLVFNDDFDGPTKLRFPLFDNSDFDDINTVSLKASFTDSFPTRTNTNRYSPLDSTYTRDVWMRDTQLAMGNPVADSTYVHLYINGLYWGLYWPSERNDDQFVASRLGGEPEDWDIVRDFNELFRGQRTAFDQMMSLSRQIAGASASQANDLFEQIQGKLPNGTNDPATDALLDVDNFIDYIILHLYAGVEDWPSHNWYAARNRVDPGNGFIFMTWDQEIGLDQLYRDRTGANSSNSPGELFQNLRNSSEFRLRFADRVQKHLFNDGVLTTASSQQRWMKRADQIEAAIIGESARWGDAREGEFITAYTSLGPFGDGQIATGSQTVPLMTVDHWRDSIAYVRDSFLVHAGDLLISRLLNDNLYTSLDPPTFQINGANQRGGLINSGDSLGISAPGTVYYTLDGSDPRAIGGGIAGVQYSSAIAIDATTVVKARTFSGGNWSALTETTFTVADDLLAITEINYNPYAPTLAELSIDPSFESDDFEFIEVMNTSPTESLNLGGMQLTDAVEFTFGNVVLGPGERALVVEDVDAFEVRYGTGLNIVGQWSGGLSSGGEEIDLLNNLGIEVTSVEYSDGDPWAISADGDGATLVLADPADTPVNQRDKYYRWRGSVEFGGTPGIASGTMVAADRVVINELIAHTSIPETDFIELFNPTDQDIDISGWFLSDAGGTLEKYEIPPGIVLAAGAYLVFDESDFNVGGNAFALNAAGDEVYLTRPDGVGGVLFVDQVEFGASFNGESLGRVPNGSGRFAPLVSPTPGAPNGAPRIADVVISEVNYHPQDPTTAAQDAYQAIAGTGTQLIDNDLEFIEIHNASAATVDLSNWRLRGESDIDFAVDTMLASGANLVVVSFNPATDGARLAGFIEHYGLAGSGVTIVGGLSNNLNNGFGRVELEQPDAGASLNHVTADEVLYDDQAPWPTSAVDGGGRSLNRRTARHFGNDATSWLSKLPSPGVTAFEVGDFDGDRDVDGVDFLVWQRNLGTIYTAADLITWKASYRTVTPPITSLGRELSDLSDDQSPPLLTSLQPAVTASALDAALATAWLGVTNEKESAELTLEWNLAEEVLPSVYAPSDLVFDGCATQEVDSLTDIVIDVEDTDNAELAIELTDPVLG